MANKITNVKKLDGAIEVNFGDGTNIRYEDCWLRDSCRCPSCYHADKFQRAKHLLAIPEAKIHDVRVESPELIITWSDDHKTIYSADFLVQFDYKVWSKSRRLNPILWRGPRVADKIARVDVAEFLGTTEGPKRVFQSLLNYGVSLIHGVDATVEATEKVCQALGGVQHTLFGGMWKFTNIAEHADTAYTNLPLAVHNDNTYFTEAAGSSFCELGLQDHVIIIMSGLRHGSIIVILSLQVLHCIEHLNPVGGETILVDGFYGAKLLKEDCPECYQFLTMFDVEAEYIEDGHHHTYSAPVITVDKVTEDIKQIRFNVYDRSPMAFKRPDECRSYYRSLRTLAHYYENPENQWQFKLSPGTVMVMDNFRVLHGRTGFSGQRILCGSYVSRSDWLNKARSLDLIN